MDKFLLGACLKSSSIVILARFDSSFFLYFDQVLALKIREIKNRVGPYSFHWWLRLGIDIERTQPGHPEQNGRHERMHLTLKQETTRPPGENQLKQ